jgi:crotonobetainyl-CoA:carnitine CoA-transferase CaiB-like acyl-CoA transferase
MAAPFGVYETADTRFVSIAMSPYNHLVKTLGEESLLAYDDPELLYAKRDEIWGKLNEVTRRFDCPTLLAKLLAADIWAAEINDFRRATEDEQVRHLGLIQSYHHARAGEVQVVGSAINMSETPPAISRPAPMIGEHGRELLREVGLADAEIDALLASGDISIDTGEALDPSVAAQ